MWENPHTSSAVSLPLYFPAAGSGKSNVLSVLAVASHLLALKDFRSTDQDVIIYVSCSPVVIIFVEAYDHSTSNFIVVSHKDNCNRVATAPPQFAGVSIEGITAGT